MPHPEDGPHRLRVAAVADSQEILEYATPSPYRAKPAYATSVETTVYVAPGPAAFRHVGTYREVGRKFGRYWDLA